MNIPRWIKDTNPEQSMKDRIECLLFAIGNYKTREGKEFISDRELTFWILDELTAMWNKIEKETK